MRREDRDEDGALLGRSDQLIGKALRDLKFPLVKEDGVFRNELAAQQIAQLLAERLLKLLHPAIAIGFTRVADEYVETTSGNVSHEGLVCELYIKSWCFLGNY